MGDDERENVNSDIGILVQADSELGRSYFQVPLQTNPVA
jgi:hypothetical protein